MTTIPSQDRKPRSNAADTGEAAARRASDPAPREGGAGRAAAVFLLVVAFAAAVAWAGSQGGASVGGRPVFAVVVAAIFLIQFLAFIPAWLKQTEHFYDLVGSSTYVVAIVGGVLLSGHTDAQALVLAGLVVVWAARLGPFLFRRVRRTGRDDRFDPIKPHFGRFLNVWTLQGLWVTITLSAALAAVTAAGRPALGVLTIVGVLVWLGGFVLEVVADAQKNRFRADRANQGTFIRTGLWSWSRHPNYFGEITLWFGVAIAALPALTGWQFVTLISPVFVYLLITRVSGVPLLERKADARWGGQADYEQYKASTPVLVPRPPRRVL